MNNSTIPRPPNYPPPPLPDEIPLSQRPEIRSQLTVPTYIAPQPQQPGGRSIRRRRHYRCKKCGRCIKCNSRTQRRCTRR